MDTDSIIKTRSNKLRFCVYRLGFEKSRGADQYVHVGNNIQSKSCEKRKRKFFYLTTCSVVAPEYFPTGRAERRPDYVREEPRPKIIHLGKFGSVNTSIILTAKNNIYTKNFS